MWVYTPKQTGDIFWLAYEIAEDIILCYLTSNIHYGYDPGLFGVRFNIVLSAVSIIWIHVEHFANIAFASHHCMNRRK